MNALVYRGLRLFFKSKQAVLGSFIGALIMIGLYVFLLGDSVVNQLSALSHPQLVVDTRMLAGVIGIASASSTLGSVSLMIRDKERSSINSIDRYRWNTSRDLSKTIFGKVFLFVSNKKALSIN